jgi:hypothetical protein
MRTSLITIILLVTSCQPSLAQQNDFSRKGFLSGIGPGAQSFAPPSTCATINGIAYCSLQPASNCLTGDGKAGHREYLGRATGEQCVEN